MLPIPAYQPGIFCLLLSTFTGVYLRARASTGLHKKKPRRLVAAGRPPQTCLLGYYLSSDLRHNGFQVLLLALNEVSSPKPHKFSLMGPTNTCKLF